MIPPLIGIVPDLVYGWALMFLLGSNEQKERASEHIAQVLERMR
jgi:hypothetical protein